MKLLKRIKLVPKGYTSRKKSRKKSSSGYDWLGYQLREKRDRRQWRRERREKRKLRSRIYPSDAAVRVEHIEVDGNGRTYARCVGGQLLKIDIHKSGTPLEMGYIETSHHGTLEVDTKKLDRHDHAELANRPSRSKYFPVVEGRKHNK